MQQKTFFHESYYDHSCTISPEKDVLQTDITGKGKLQNLKRWWNGLFLLSYHDERSRVYYTSSHSIRVERLKQFRYYKNKIHPLSIFRNFWDCLFIFVIIASEVLFQHNSSLILGQFPLVFYYIAVLLECIVIIDLYVNFKTGYIDINKKRIILDVHRGRIHYCSTKLFFHCASAVPLQLIMFLRYGNTITCIICKSNRFICVLKILSIFRLTRIFEATKYWTRKRRSFVVTHFFCLLRICVVGLITMHKFLELKDVTCLLLILIKGEIAEDSYYIKRLKHRFNNINPTSNFQLFCLNFSRVCKSYLLFNFTFSIKTYYVEKITSLIGYMIANVFYGWSILEFYTVISRLKFAEDRVLWNKSTSMNLMRSRQLPDRLSDTVSRYHNFNISKLKNTENQNGLFICIPKTLKTEMLMSCYRRRVARVPYFHNWPTNVIVNLVLLLKAENYVKGDIVAETWVQGDGLIIVDMGLTAVYTSQNEEIGHLIDGDYFGEVSLVTDREVRTSYVVALSCCKILLLPKESFRTLMRQYKYLFLKMEREIQLKYPTMKTSVTRHGYTESDDD